MEYAKELSALVNKSHSVSIDDDTIGSDLECKVTFFDWDKLDEEVKSQFVGDVLFALTEIKGCIDDSGEEACVWIHKTKKPIAVLTDENIVTKSKVQLSEDVMGVLFADTDKNKLKFEYYENGAPLPLSVIAKTPSELLEVLGLK